MWIGQDEWKYLIRRFDDIVIRLSPIEAMENQIMTTVNQELDELEAQTRAIDSAEDSAEAAFTRLAAMIDGLKNNQTDPATAARIHAAADELRSRAARLAAAVDAAPKDDVAPTPSPPA